MTKLTIKRRSLKPKFKKNKRKGKQDLIKSNGQQTVKKRKLKKNRRKQPMLLSFQHKRLKLRLPQQMQIKKKPNFRWKLTRQRLNMATTLQNWREIFKHKNRKPNLKKNKERLKKQRGKLKWKESLPIRKKRNWKLRLTQTN